MKFATVLTALAGCAALAGAAELKLSNKDDERQQCNGMYNKATWGGDVNPFIMAVINNGTDIKENTDPVVSVVIYEWRDEELLGIPSKSQPGQKEMICLDSEIREQYCTEAQYGEFLLAPNASDLWINPIMTKPIHLKNTEALDYKVTKTGYYCIITFSDAEYSGAVEYRNAYGELPASQIPKLPFYGGMTIVYAVIGLYWGFLYFQNRHDILPVQNYITAIIGFLIVEQILTWGYYDYQNRHGDDIGNKIFMVVTAILNAGRNTFSFFLLLIVCMGYGIVKPSLGKTMVYVRILALAHFSFGVIYGVASLSVNPDNAGPLVLLVVLPLAATLTLFYVWTLNALSATLKDLMTRKQFIKAMMFKRLWWCILGSILVIFAFLFFNSFKFASRSDPNFVPNNWKARWFVLDGWLNIVYFFDICFIAYLWRPTANNRRFAMSDEIAQDEEGGFEIASFGGLSDDEDDDRRKNGGPKPPAYGGVPSHAGGQTSGIISAPPQAATSPARGPLTPIPPVPETTTIFAVGDGDDEWSEDEQDEEHKSLAKQGS